MLSTQDRILAELSFVIAQENHRQNRLDPAKHWYKNVLALDPENADVNYALIYPHALQRQYKEALEYCDKVILMDNQHSINAAYTKALINLNLGNYIEGFEGFETRLRLPQKLAPDLPFPYWDGQPCNVLHVYGEQGYGDIFMFARYIPLIKDKFNVKKILYQVHKPCGSLLKYNFRNNPEIEIIDTENRLEYAGVIDYKINVVSLARIFKTTIDTIPPIHFEAEPEYIEKYKKYKGHIAVCYGGRNAPDFQAQEWNSRRNFPKDVLDKILEGRKFVSIQQEHNPYELKSFSDTAGIIANCDMTITVDTGPYHLAAAMGGEVVLLNHYQTCWRHELEGPITRWYPKNVRILRQKVEADWSSVASELKEYLDGKTKSIAA